MPVYSSSGFFATKRQSGWSFEHRDKHSNVGGLSFSWELASQGGAHFHLWVPRTHPKLEATIIRDAVDELRSQRDVVSWSWDYIPEGE